MNMERVRKRDRESFTGRGKVLESPPKATTII